MLTPAIKVKSKNQIYIIFLVGLISGFAFAPVFFLPGLFCGVSYLCYKNKMTNNISQSFYIGYIFGFGHFLSGLYWICIGVSVYIEEFWWALPFALFGLPLVLAVFIALTCTLSKYFKDSSHYSFIFSISWVLFEWIRSWIFTGLPWNLAGYSLSFAPILIQSASVFGIYGLSFIVIYLASGLHYFFIDRTGRELKLALINLIIISCIMILYGVARINNNPTEYLDINVKLIQPSTPQTSKWEIEEFLNDVDKLVHLSTQGAQADLIIWSEAALIIPYYYPIIKSKLKNMLKSMRGVLITGGVTDNDKTGEEFQLYSSMLALNREYRLLYAYHKSHLVPFGEYMPLRNILPIKKLTPGLIDYSKGDNNLVYLEQYNLWIRPLICYESIFPFLARTRNDTADVIINITNDSWYGNSSGPYQHLYISIMRAVENGLPMIRVANSGISVVVDPLGRIIKKMPLNTVDFIDSELPAKLDYVTTYSKFGDIMVIILIFVIIIFYLLIRLITEKLFLQYIILD